ncbi:MAG: leucine-rich repeat domain-containing protein [Deltaproteobacteria bacterium]|jgi:Leucine-rich repeat (LRR) protein|nr:leucine-rich repeat domain-containing protein [Deltaproteobacteria bacterium]
MKKRLEVTDPLSVLALSRLVKDHPEADLKWELDQGKVLVSDQEGIFIRLKEGCLIGLSLYNEQLKGPIDFVDIPSLKYLKINCPKVTQVRLAKLANLSLLVLKNLDLPPRKKALFFEDLASLESLRLNFSKLVDLKALSALTSLTDLNLDNNAIKSLEPLTGLVQLKKLSLVDNRLQEVTALSSFDQLEEVNLAFNKLKNLIELMGLNNLRCLDLSGNRFKDFEFLPSLIGLKELRLNQVGPKVTKHLESLTKLKTLELRGNRITDLDFLKSLSALTYLDLSDNGLICLEGLEGHHQLTNLILRNNKIFNLSPLADLEGLRELDLGHNLIHDLRPLKMISFLKDLDLRNNMLTDITPLRDIPSLIWVNLSNNVMLNINGTGEFIEKLEFSSKSAFLEENSNQTQADTGQVAKKASRLGQVSRARSKGPGAKGPGLKGPGLKGPAAKGPGLKGPGEKILSPSGLPLRVKRASQPLESDLADKNVLELLAALINAPPDPELRGQLYQAFIDKIFFEDLDEDEFKRLLMAKQLGLALQDESDQNQVFEPGENDELMNELGRLLIQRNGQDFMELLTKVAQANAEEPPDEVVVYNSLEEIEDLPPELIEFLKRLGGEPTMVKVKKIKKPDGFDGLPPLPKGTVLIRCQVERKPADDSDDQDQRSPNNEFNFDFDNQPGDFLAKLSRATGQIFSDHGQDKNEWPFFRRKSGPDNTYSRKDQEEYLRFQRMFFLLDYNPAKFSLH